MPELAISLLGPLTVEVDGKAVTRFRVEAARALLAYLAMHPDVVCRRDALAALLWPDRPDDAALRNLRVALSRLRTALEDRDATSPALLVTSSTLQLNPDAKRWLDVSAFSARLAAVEQHAHAPPETCASCLQRLQEAVELYRGEFLSGLYVPSSLYEEWMVVQRESLHLQALGALSHLAAYHLGRGEHELALQYARRQVELEPWREGAHRQCMRALALSGQRGAALAQYQTCRRILSEELGVEPEEETQVLYEQIRDGADVSGLPTLTGSRAAPPHNLPAQLTPFVGREGLLGEIGARLADRRCRLLTLLGPGGSGKTRLALEAVGRLLDEGGRECYPDGVFFVSLAPLHSAEGIVPAVAQAVGFSFHGARPAQEQLLDHLRAKHMLLLLDNYEHLLAPPVSPPVSGTEGGAILASDILRAAPGVQILATSRARLNVGGEHLFPIRGMDYPETGEEDAFERYSAVQLFLSSVRRVRPDLEPEAEDLVGVAEVCRKVEGMPLAILLAAAWIEILFPAEIAAEIERSLDFLEGELRDAPARQRSLRAVFDHSWHLLSGRQQEIFAGLSVFRGGFAREAAEQVAGASLRDLMALVNRSLLHRTATGRYEMHELLRQYAADKLSGRPAEQEQALDRHCEYYAEFLHARERDVALRGALRAALPELDNLRAAWRRAVREDKPAQVRKLWTGLDNLYTMQGLFEEGAATSVWPAEVLRARGPVGENGIALGLVLGTQARLSLLEGRPEKAREFAREGVSLLRKLGTQRELVRLIFTAIYVGVPESVAEGEQLLEESMAIAKELDIPEWEADALDLLGDYARYRGAYNKAETYHRRALEICERIGYRTGTMLTYLCLGHLARERGAYAEAQRWYEARLALSAEAGYTSFTPAGYRYLAVLAVAAGDEASAVQNVRRALQSEARIHHVRGILLALDVPARLLARKGDLERAAELTTLVLSRLVALETSNVEHLETRDRLQALLDRLQAELPADAFAAAQERGRARDLWVTVEELLAEPGE